MNIRFACPHCDAPASVDFPGRSLSADWQCPHCDHRLTLTPPAEGEMLQACAACGNHQLYRMKDFPHALGMAILVSACLASVVSYWLYYKWLTWGILIGSALFDGLLYLWVGDVTVCYRCYAHHRGHVANPEHHPHELTTAERYRQERLRREASVRRVSRKTTPS